MKNGTLFEVFLQLFGIGCQLAGIGIAIAVPYLLAMR
jgi:hypothetical protein